MPEWFKKLWGKKDKTFSEKIKSTEGGGKALVAKLSTPESVDEKMDSDDKLSVASQIGNQAMSEIQDEDAEILKELEAGTENSSLSDKENLQSEEVEPDGEEAILKKLRDDVSKKGKLEISDYEGIPGQLPEIPRVEAPDNVFSKGGLKVKNFFKNRFNSIKKSIVKGHREAVDDYNHYTDDYKKQGAWDRFTWALSNPIAWIRAGVGKNTTELDTIERDLERAKLNRIAENISTVMGKSEDTDMSLEEILGEKKGEQNSSIGESGGSKDIISKEGSLLEEGTNASDKKDSSGEVPKFDPEFSNAGETVKGLADGLSFIKDATYLFDSKMPKGVGNYIRGPLLLAAAAGNITKAYESSKRGDEYGAIEEGLNAAENVSFAASSFLTGAALGGKASEAVGNLTYKALPAVGILTGAIQTGRGIANLVGYNKQKKNIGNIITKINDLSKDKKTDPRKRAKYLKILNQINNFSEVNKTKGGIDIASGALYTLGNIGKASVVGMPLGIGLEFLGIGVSAVKDFIGDYQHGKIKKKTVDEEMGLEKKISAIRKWIPGIDREKAQYVVLKSMGIDSGTKTEAFQRMTMKRAKLLKDMADKGGTLSEKIVQSMNLKRTNHGYSLQAIAMKLGMGDNPWQEQLRETIKKRKNPFRKDTQ